MLVPNGSLFTEFTVNSLLNQSFLITD